MKKQWLWLALLMLALPTFGQNSSTGNITAAGTTCATTHACIVLTLPNDYGGATITLSGTFVGTLQFEGSGDSVNYASLSATPLAGGSAVTSATAAGTWQVSTVGLQVVRVRCSAFTSGTVVVTIQASKANSGGIGGGGGGGGSPAFSAITSGTNTSAAMVVGSGASIAASGTGTITATSSVNSAPNNAYYFSPNCGAATNCTTIHDDAGFVTDATTTTAGVVTCPNSDCNFIAADVGKTAWVTTQGSQETYGAAFVCAQSTIATVNSAQSITLTSGSCASAVTGVGVLFWGTKDGTTIENAMAANCGSFLFPATSARFPLSTGKILVDQPFGNSLASCAQGQPFISMNGSTPSASSVVFILTPDFNWAGCTGNNGYTQYNGNSNDICFGSEAIGINYMSFYGGGLSGGASCSGAGGKTLVAGSDGVSSVSVNINGICPGVGLLEGIELNGLDENLFYGGAINTGQYSCVFNGLASQGMGNACWNNGPSQTGNGCATHGLGICVGVVVAPSAQFQDLSSWMYGDVFVAGSMTSRGTTFCGTTQTNYTGGYAVNLAGSGGGSWVSDGDYINPSGCSAQLGGTIGGGVNLGGGGDQVYMKNTQFNSVGASYTAISMVGTGTNSFFDQCGNNFGGVVGTLITLTTGNVFGNCSTLGTPAASSNVALGAGFGSSPSSGTFVGPDQRNFHFTITVGTGTQTQATSTVTYTFPKAFLQAPGFCQATQQGGTNPLLTFQTSTQPTTTSVVFTPTAVATASDTIILAVQCS